jgi:hypothetical protein
MKFSKQLLTVIFYSLCIGCCKEEDKYLIKNRIYQINKTPGWTFRKNESGIASIFIDKYRNGITEEPRSRYLSRAYCDCYAEGDTLLVQVPDNLRGQFRIQLIKDSLQTSFYEYREGTPSDPYLEKSLSRIYKQIPDDSSFQNYITVRAKYQTLQLKEELTYKTGQKISGYINFTSEKYYENNYKNVLDTIFLKSEIYFSCYTRSPWKKDKYSHWQWKYKVAMSLGLPY